MSKKFSHLFPLFPLFLLLPSLILNVLFYQKLSQANSLPKVKEVVDGDTLTLDSGEKIRLININAPELQYCGGPDAKERLKILVEGKVVKIEKVNNDVYNRTLALVYQNNKLINQVLLEEGLVRYDSSPSPQKDLLLKTSQTARENKIGIFTKCIELQPDKEGCLIKGNIERNTNIKHYHFPGCSNYLQMTIEKDLGESWFCSEQEAEKNGFTKSSECYGKLYQED